MGFYFFSSTTTATLYLPRILGRHLVLVLVLTVHVCPALAVEALEALVAMHRCGLLASRQLLGCSLEFAEARLYNREASVLARASGHCLNPRRLRDGRVHCDLAGKSRELLLHWCLFLGPLGTARRLIRVIVVHEQGESAHWGGGRCRRLLGLLVGLDALLAGPERLSLCLLGLVLGKLRAVLDGVTRLTAIAAFLTQQSAADDASIVVLRPVTAVFLCGFACILADLAAWLGIDA